MSDPISPHIKARNDSSWGLYQRDNFWKLNDGEVPLFNTRQQMPLPRDAADANNNLKF
jgi:hypothetical protein